MSRSRVRMIKWSKGRVSGRRLSYYVRVLGILRRDLNFLIALEQDYYMDKIVQNIKSLPANLSMEEKVKYILKV